jgi:hypothetical protein
MMQVGQVEKTEEKVSSFTVIYFSAVGQTACRQKRNYL